MGPDDGQKTEKNGLEIDRRTVLGLVGASAVSAVAGCSGGGDGEGGDGDGGEATVTATETAAGNDGDGGEATVTATETAAGSDGDGGGSGDCPSAGTSGGLQDPGVANGELVRQAIDELEVTAIESSLVESSTGDQILRVAVTFKNNADVEVNARDYTTDLTVYDDSCNNMEIGGVTQSGGGTMKPGETATIYVNPNDPEIDHTNIAGYELTVDCSGPFADGEFCPESSN